jgi:hypothetical protein
MKKAAVMLFLLAAAAASALDSGDDLVVDPEDVTLEEGADGGYHLWVRKKPGLGSVLLTESTEDPDERLDIFAYRDPAYNPINGDEKRLLNGVFLEAHKGIVDSTAEKHPALGEAFHLFIPYVVVYGYPWSRSGEVQVVEGTFLNLKTFSMPHADWAGETRDNPFVLRLAPEKEQRLRPDGDFLPAAVEELTAIARSGGGQAILAAGKEDLLPSMQRVLDGATGSSLDLVLALDTTLSMKEEMPVLKERLVPFLRPYVARFDSLRIGLLYYRDYFEQYLVKTFPFSEDLEAVQKRIDLARIHGGKEIPEAVFEALWSGLESYGWNADEKVILLIGDAPPHPLPRGSVTKEMVYERAGELGVTLHTIILPQ